MSSADDDPTPRQATWAEVVPVVLASFFGVRKRGAMRKDAVRVRPHQVVVAGLAAAALFVLVLLLLVRVIIRVSGA